MRSIDSHYLNSWIQAASLVLDQEPPVHLLLEEASEPVIINLEGRRNPDLGLLANRLVRIYGDDVGQPVYGPQLLWLREWGIWDDNNESIASEEFAALLRGFGQTSGTRGLLFEHDESPARQQCEKNAQQKYANAISAIPGTIGRGVEIGAGVAVGGQLVAGCFVGVEQGRHCFQWGLHFLEAKERSCQCGFGRAAANRSAWDYWSRDKVHCGKLYGVKST